MELRSLVAAALAACVLAAGCSTSPDTAAPADGQGASAPSQPGSQPVTKLLVVVEENHSLSEMRAGMPYAYGLAEEFGYATNYFAVAHPSLPNYLAMAGGQTYGIVDDANPSAHPLAGDSVFGQAVSSGQTAALFADGMLTACATVNQGQYAVRHNPWAYFVSERAACQRYDQPLAALDPAIAAGALPNIGMVIPDLCHDAHSCDLSGADAWFQSLMTKVFAGPDWQSGHLAVVLTADEDDHSEHNRVLTVLIHPSQHHDVVSARLDHYSLTRLCEDVLHAPYLNRAASAASMAAAFGLPVG